MTSVAVEKCTVRLVLLNVKALHTEWFIPTTQQKTIQSLPGFVSDAYDYALVLVSTSLEPRRVVEKALAAAVEQEQKHCGDWFLLSVFELSNRKNENTLVSLYDEHRLEWKEFNGFMQLVRIDLSSSTLWF